MTEITSVVPGILGAVGGLLLVFGIFRFAWARVSGETFNGGAGQMVIGGIGIVLSGFVLPTVLNTLLPPAKTDAGTPTTPKTSTPQPPSSGTNHGPDWSHILPWVAGIGALVLLLIGAGVGVAVAVEARNKKKARLATESQRLDRVWDEAVARHDKVRDAWMTHQTDIDKILDLPVLSDLANPKVAALVDALGHASDLASSRRPATSDEIERYSAAVRTAETAWTVALTEAQRIRLSNFAPEEQDTLIKVRRLMNQALNSASTPEERRAFYEKARGLLGDLIHLPQPFIEVLENAGFAGILEAAPGDRLTDSVIGPSAARKVAQRRPRRSDAKGRAVLASKSR